MTAPLGAQVEALLDQHLRDFEHLEIALLLHSNPSRDWTLLELSAALPISRELLAGAIVELEASGLIAPTGSSSGRFIFSPRTPELGNAMVALSAAQAENRLAIISRLSLNAISRIRSSSIRAFADAFVFAKGNKHG